MRFIVGFACSFHVAPSFGPVNENKFESVEVLFLVDITWYSA